MRHSQETAGLVLVVEDNRNISEMIGEYLEGRGFEVDYATDGLDGYRLAVENSYDVLVLDLMLPRLDGMEVCKRLRTEGRGEREPVASNATADGKRRNRRVDIVIKTKIEGREQEAERSPPYLGS